MVSTLKKSKWLNSDQVLAKVAEENVPDTEEDSNESINSYQYSENSSNPVEEISCFDCFVVTIDEVPLERTSLLSSRTKSSNFRDCINNYKSKSATIIQRFIRARKRKIRITSLIKTLKNLLQKAYKRKTFKKIRIWLCSQINAAKIIQKAWKHHKQSKISQMFSPRRQLLARAVSIGGTIIRINNYIDEILSRSRSPSPESSLVSNNSPILRRSSLQIKKKISCINLIPSFYSDESETTETISSTPLLELSVNQNCKIVSVDLSTCDCESVQEDLKQGSLLMKKPFKVRIKKKTSKMSLNELEEKCRVDYEEYKNRRIAFIDSCIPQFKEDSVFFISKDRLSLFS
ncbi:hypothetical protein SteCoe_32185 [Stentor coeruleus]|uniref:Uncharacterized protein n=1 Tax=Stentor coeruleus TaxID=5963 RepID=A0A1R2AZM4_9CILI|nr:hypothetical protein SteCoe_32185 [Stentor coeruleus]